METKQLMVNDWVYNTHHKENIRITVYDFFTHSHKDGKQSFKDVIEPIPTLGRDLLPITLTPEILEKNGFKKINSQRYDFGHPDADCYVKVNPKKNMIHVNGRNANSNLYSHSYVHELQHALRLCGLWELADNIKVE